MADSFFWSVLKQAQFCSYWSFNSVCIKLCIIAVFIFQKYRSVSVGAEEYIYEQTRYGINFEMFWLASHKNVSRRGSHPPSCHPGAPAGLTWHWPAWLSPYPPLCVSFQIWWVCIFIYYVSPALFQVVTPLDPLELCEIKAVKRSPPR